jgi:hypothetical protein
MLTIENILQQEMDAHYNNLNHKIDLLQHKKQKRNKTDHNTQTKRFYPRTVNLTKIEFNREEMTLLNKGLQYSIIQPRKKLWTNLIIETEQAIKLLDVKLQQTFRILATKKLKQILDTDNHRNALQKRQAYTINNINDKLVKCNAVLTKANKGKTSVILYLDDYTEKVHTFLMGNNFQTINNPQTNSKNY